MMPRRSFGPAIRNRRDSWSRFLTARPTDAICYLAWSTLEKMGAPALPPLRRILAEGDDKERVQGAWLLGRVRPVEPETVAALARALRDLDHGVRMNAGAALRSMGPEAAGAVPALVDAIERTTDFGRGRFIDAVGAIGPAAAAAEPVLRRLLLDSDDAFLRVTLATALARIGSPAADLLPGVLEAAQSGTGSVRHHAVSSLAHFGSEGARVTEVLGKVLFDADVTVRMCAAEAPGRIGPPAVDAVPALQAACSDGDRLVQSLAASALRKVRGG
jgi:HEAT repeat protein